MQRLFIRPQFKPTVPAQRSAPVPLDPKELQHVAGGSPRGGWQAELVGASYSTSSPRGGWL